MSVSILILTLNEEANLPGCLESVKWSNDIVIFDSFSTDRTVEIAKAFGARVFQREFDNWAAHQNWAVKNISYANDWIFYLDADERMTGELKEEIEQVSGDPQEKRVAFYCSRKNYFMGRWIKHAFPPIPILRFFKPAYIQFERLVNPVPIINGHHGYLHGQFLHHSFSKGITEWIEKHNKYSQFEAEEGIKVLMSKPFSLVPFLSRDAALLRRGLKTMSFRLPFRPILRFVYMYFIRLGFLDGWAGLTYCRLMAMYEYMIVLKMKELQRKQQGLPV